MLDFIAAKDGRDNCDYTRRAKLQSNRHRQQTNTQLFYRLDALPVAQLSVRALNHDS